MSPRSAWAAKLGLVVAALVVVGIGLEILLRLWPTLLGYSFANGALSRYTVRDGGIYYYDRSVRMNFMIPNHRATMFANGYVWHHETDVLGFRNATLHIPTDVVLLGDSLVYGHGMDFADTVGAQLERRSGLRVANLGRQGDCAYQEAYLLTTYIDVLKPRFVVYVFTPNDIADLYVYLSDQAMEAFIAQPLDAIRYPPRTPPEIALRERAEKIRRQSVWKRVEEKSYVFKMGRWIQHRYRDAGPHAGIAVAEAAGRAALRVDTAIASTDPGSLGWRYTEHAIAYMDHLSRRRGARLLMIPITSGRQLEILLDIAARHGVHVVDTRRLVATADAFLPNDGHFSPAGARLAAELIAERVR